MPGGMAERFRRWFEYEKDAHAKVLRSLETVPDGRRAASPRSRTSSTGAASPCRRLDGRRRDVQVSGVSAAKFSLSRGDVMRYLLLALGVLVAGGPGLRADEPRGPPGTFEDRFEG